MLICILCGGDITTSDCTCRPPRRPAMALPPRPTRTSSFARVAILAATSARLAGRTAIHPIDMRAANSALKGSA